MTKNKKILLLLLLTAVLMLTSACGSADPYEELSTLLSLKLPEPDSYSVNGRVGDLTEISLGENFDLALQYSDASFRSIADYEEWNPLSNPQLGELATLLLMYYQHDMHAATPKAKLDTLNEYLGDTLEKGDRWFMKKELIVPGDRLIFLLEEENQQIRTYYIAP